jgi:hypothetical protein
MAAALANAWTLYKERNGLPADLPIQQANPPLDEQHPLWGLQVILNGGQPTPAHFTRAWRALHDDNGLPVPPLLPGHHPLFQLYVNSGWRAQHPNGVLPQAGGRRRKSRKSRKGRKTRRNRH